MIAIPPIYRWNALTDRQRASVLERLAVPADPALEARVKDIMEKVRSGGDRALRELEAELDGVELDEIEAGESEIAAAGEQLSAQQREAIGAALDNIRT